MILGDLDISIDNPRWLDVLPNCEEIINRCAITALKSCETDPQGRPCELSILLSSDDDVHALNKKYREKDKPTNVLSFPALECEFPGKLVIEPGPLHLGDIVLALGVVEQEAMDQNIPLEHHLSHLIIHGVLHLIGFDHIDDLDAEEMESLEITILKDFGIANPYASEAQS